MSKRPYSQAFPPTTAKPPRYLLDRIPAGLWRDARAKAKCEGVSMRALILGLLKAWASGAEG